MSDPRFFKKSGPFSLIEIANLINGDLSCENESILIENISKIIDGPSNRNCYNPDYYGVFLA